MSMKIKPFVTLCLTHKDEPDGRPVRFTNVKKECLVCKRLAMRSYYHRHVEAMRARAKKYHQAKKEKAQLALKKEMEIVTTKKRRRRKKGISAEKSMKYSIASAFNLSASEVPDKLVNASLALLELKKKLKEMKKPA